MPCCQPLSNCTFVFGNVKRQIKLPVYECLCVQKFKRTHAETSRYVSCSSGFTFDYVTNKIIPEHSIHVFLEKEKYHQVWVRMKYFSIFLCHSVAIAWQTHKREKYREGKIEQKKGMKVANGQNKYGSLLCYLIMPVSVCITELEAWTVHLSFPLFSIPNPYANCVCCLFERCTALNLVGWILTQLPLNVLHVTLLY